VNEYYNDLGVASRAIMGRLKGGLLVASGTKKDRTETKVVSIPHQHWGSLAVKNADWWDTGDIRVWISGAHSGAGEYLYFDVHFNSVGLAAMVAGKSKIKRVPLATSPKFEAPPPSTPAVEAAKPPQSRAGRPSKGFWEDMVIAATRAILYDDTLKAKTQADVLRWMADWAIENGHGHPGETALKERARKVFLATRE
jgi:hypothetical protein